MKMRKSNADQTVCGIYIISSNISKGTSFIRLLHTVAFEKIVTRMDTPKHGETLKFMYIKYQPILVVLPSLIMV